MKMRHGIILAEGGMNAEELENIVARHERQCLELKGALNVERIDELFSTVQGYARDGNFMRINGYCHLADA